MKGLLNNKRSVPEILIDKIKSYPDREILEQSGNLLLLIKVIEKYTTPDRGYVPISFSVQT